MSDKMLDCSNLTTEDFEKIKMGFEVFKLDRITGKGSIFGRIGKSDMKALVRKFNYTDKATLIKGGILGAGAVWVGSKLKKNFNQYRNKVIQTLGSEIKEEEKTEDES